MGKRSFEERRRETNARYYRNRKAAQAEQSQDQGDPNDLTNVDDPLAF
jgi:hypothetical protein